MRITGCGRRAALCSGLAWLALATAGCGVGDGAGAASGKLFVLDCSSSGDYCDSTGYCGTPSAPADYDLQPGFFAGEPIDGATREVNGSQWTGSQPGMNRLIIRLQRSGKQIENTDTLFIDVVNAFEVARCVRGREAVQADGSTQHDYDDRYCSRASATGPARVRISYYGGIVHGTLSPRLTCIRPVDASADDLFPVDGVVQVESSDNWRSWIEFADFGSAAQNDKADPTTRDPVSPTFQVELGQRLHASAFSLTLLDEKVEVAQVELKPPLAPDIGGSLTGWFDFHLTRGQGAQMFP